MDKQQIGLPQGFAINVKPVEVGDYIDETTNSTAKLDIAQEQKECEPTSTESSIAAVADTKPPVPKTRRKRKQINMSPETQRKFEEIISHVQDYGPQDDAAASEIMDAIVSAHHQSLSHLRFGSVKSRGRWGTPTASAFIHALSQEFVNAVLEHYKNASAV